ncbi:cellulase family glycosylhydrolase [Mycobacterium hodleri]|uniref:glycoside hydrolase family 5 protein n=1 Tax=Mycolicibacterium hodleri TaxID=49897 RepID=UPI0021F34D6B|nr:glycoside hydrolase family 5 protein [Mycolicibacterium hodleri]MCV7135293.1 cellulase family glycosylhydrolase [Mycolicibacterium hodleri]
MKKTPRGLLKTLATRSVIAAIPVAMVSAYATNVVAPMPPRIAAYEYQQVAEITVSPNTVGVAASPLYGQTKAQIDQQLNEMQALGVQNIRVFVPWGLVDYFGPSAPGSLSWATLDLVMQSAKEHDMGVLAEVDSTPPYAVTAGIPGSGTPDPAAFAAFMTKFATKYGSTVSAYEIWNEPNAVLSSNPINPAAYAALVKAAYQAIKPIDPTATIVAGAVGHVVTVGNLTMDPVDFVKAMIAADPTIGQYFDALSYHPYDESLPFSQGNVNPNSGIFASDTAYNQLKDLIALFPTKKVWLSEFGVPTYSYTDANAYNQLKDLIALFPTKKVWLSEFGVPTYSYTDANGVVHTVTQDQQEKLIADLVNSWGAAFGQNAGPIFLYTGRDTLTGSSNPEDNYGLWDMLGPLGRTPGRSSSTPDVTPSPAAQIPRTTTDCGTCWGNPRKSSPSSSPSGTKTTHKT